MKTQHIFIATLLILSIGLLVKQLTFKIPQRGFTIISKQHNGNYPPFNQPKPTACLPFEPRKKWFAFLYSKNVWQRTRRIVKNNQTGKKVVVNGKQSVRLKKIVFNPA